MGLREALKQKYGIYESHGYSVFTVTLSTYVKNRGFAKGCMGDFWDHHFIGRVTRCLPFKMKKKFDHDYIVEPSREGNYHYHGMMAFTKDAGEKIWRDDTLNAQLKRDLDSFRSRGKHRPFCVNTHCIQPVLEGRLSTWARYITKESDILLSSMI